MSSIENIGGLLARAQASAQPAPAAKGSTTFAEEMNALEKFMAYQDMSAAEKFRASYLAEKGLTEEELAALPPEERLKIENEIAERIREKTAESFNRRNGSV